MFFSPPRLAARCVNPFPLFGTAVSSLPEDSSRAPSGRWRWGCCLGLEQSAGFAQKADPDGYKGRKNEHIPISSPRGRLTRACCPFFPGRNPGFLSGIHRLYIDSSAHRQGGSEKWTKMSDTKVKVAVRVRPMNRRGKCYNHDFSLQTRISVSSGFTLRYHKVLISSPLLLPA